MKAFGYVEEVAMTKLAISDLEQEWAAAAARKNRNAAQVKYAVRILSELNECRLHLSQLEA